MRRGEWRGECCERATRESGAGGAGAAAFPRFRSYLRSGYRLWLRLGSFSPLCPRDRSPLFSLASVTLNSSCLCARGHHFYSRLTLFSSPAPATTPIIPFAWCLHAYSFFLRFSNDIEYKSVTLGPLAFQ